MISYLRVQYLEIKKCRKMFFFGFKIDFKTMQVELILQSRIFKVGKKRMDLPIELKI